MFSFFVFSILLIFSTNIYAGLLPSVPGEHLPSVSADFNCIARYKAQTYVQEYNIDLKSFGGLELCDNSIDTKNLFNSLLIIEKGYFSGNKKNIFIQNFIPVSEYDYWAKKMTKSIRRGNDIPYATAYNRNGHFTMQDGWSKLSTLGQVGVLIHEARHTEGYGHRPCDHGPYSQSSVAGCDASVKEGGSHGVEMEYYSRVVLQGQNFHPSYTSMARLMNLARANIVFNTYPMKQQEALFVLTKTTALLLKAGKQLTISLSKNMLAMAPHLTLKRSSFGANLFGSAGAFVFDFYAWSKNKQSDLIKDTYSYYKILNHIKLNVVDLEEVDFGTKRHLVALTTDNKIKVFNFLKAQWSKGESVPKHSQLKTLSPAGEQGLFVVTTKGLIYPLDKSSLRLQAALNIQWPGNIKNYKFWNKELLELRTDKNIYHTGSGKLFSKINAEDKIIDFVEVPLYDSFNL